MKPIRRLHLLVMLTLLLASLTGLIFSAVAAEVVSKTRSSAQDKRFTASDDARTADVTPVKPTVHALFVIMDGDPGNSSQYKASARWMKDLLQRGKSGGIFDVNLTTLSSHVEDKDPSYPTPERVLEWIADAAPLPHDVVFVYYCGHGASDRGDYFDLVGQQLHVVEVVNALKRSQAATCRLRMLIADTCRVETSIKAPPGRVNPSPATGYKADRAYTHLFVEHAGFLHLASTSRGQFSWGDSENGSWFTNGLVHSIYSHPDANRRFVGWNEIFAMATKKVEKFLEQNRSVVNNRLQHPEAPSLPNRLSEGQLAQWINAHVSTPDSQARSDTARVSNQNTASRAQGAAAEIGKVKLELKGAKFTIHVPFKIHNLPRQEIDLIAVFYHEDGKPFKDKDNRYGLTDGVVATWTEVDSASEEAVFSMPTRELHLTQPGEYPFYILVVIRLPENNKELGRAKRGNWAYTLSRE